MAYELPKLDYSYDALEPHIDAQTMEIHHSKHHQTYVNNLNNVLANHADLASKPAEELVAGLKRAREDGGDLKLVVRAQGIVHELLQLMHLDRVFQIFGDGKEAAASFTAGPN